MLGSGKAEVLLGALKGRLAELNMERLLQLGMDGPNVNLKLLRLYTEDRKREDPNMPDLLDIGTCSLHVVHGAIHTGMS